MLLLDQSLGKFLTSLKAGQRIARVWQVNNQLRIKLQAARFRAVANSAPTRSAVGQSLRPADKCDLAMTERVQMLQREISTEFVVNDDRTHCVPFKFAI